MMPSNNIQSSETEIPGGYVDAETGKDLDPVCGMSVRKHAFYRIVYRDKLYKFCNEDCFNSFQKEPLKYVHKIGT